MVEMVISQTVHTKSFKIENKPTTQHHLDNKIELVTKEAFTIEDDQGQVISFTALIHVSTLIMFFIPPTLLLERQKHHHMPGEQFTRAI